MPNITPEQIESLLSELQTGLNDLAKSEASKAVKDPEVLAKAVPGEETKDEGTPAPSATPEAPKAESKPESKPEDNSASKPADESAPADAAPAAPGDMSAAPGDPAAEDDGPIDPVKLHEEYSKLSPEDLKAHYIACKAALFEIVGSGDGDGDADDTAAPAASPAAPEAPMPPPAAASPEPAPDAPPTMKGEKDMSDGGNGGNPFKETKVMKSEQDVKIETLEKELAAERDALSRLAKTMETVLTTPIRKSVVSIAELPKAPAVKSVTDLSKAEVKSKLGAKVREGKLSKSDLDLVVSFDLGKIKVQDVAHILESKTS